MFVAVTGNQIALAHLPFTLGERAGANKRDIRMVKATLDEAALAAALQSQNG